MMNDDLKKKIYSLMEQAVQNQQTAGVSLLVRKDGEELFFGVCGYADIEKQEALGRDHIFRLFSMTKPVTAVAAMILVERGMLDLNMPVSEVLPGFAGAKVMEKASRYLTPVTLELGGKSPCIVDKDCNIKRAARRIAFGKYLNCGQTCVAPDYLLIHKDVKKAFLSELSVQIKAMFTEEPLSARDYGKIINEKHFNRILGLIDPQKVVFGGHSDAQRLKIEPTVMDGITRADAVMQEEIFGPVLPVITVDSMKEAERFIKEGEKPLALYIFTDDKQTAKRFTEHVSFGGGCVNDTIMHISNPNLPFGGVGASGMGSYHGAKSFETFSHAKSVLHTYNWIDLPLRYQPYAEKTTKLIKRFLR